MNCLARLNLHQIADRVRREDAAKNVPGDYGEDENFEVRSDASHALHNHSHQSEMRPLKKQKMTLTLMVTVISFQMPFKNCRKNRVHFILLCVYIFLF